MEKIEYLDRACLVASIGMDNNEGGPFGAVIVDNTGNIISEGNNKVLIEHDPTAHAEIVAIRNASKKLKTHDLSGLTLYTSCEPCPMCLSAIIWSNIKTVYYGATRKDADRIGFRDDDIYEYLKGNNNNLLNITKIDNIKCEQLFQKYKENNKEIY